MLRLHITLFVRLSDMAEIGMVVRIFLQWAMVDFQGVDVSIRNIRITIRNILHTTSRPIGRMTPP